LKKGEKKESRGVVEPPPLATPILAKGVAESGVAEPPHGRKKKKKKKLMGFGHWGWFRAKGVVPPPPYQFEGLPMGCPNHPHGLRGWPKPIKKI
jgi:hypothetical protein